MRRVLAVLSALGGLAAVVAGVLLLTVFAPPSTLSTSVRLDGDGPVAVVAPAGVLALSGSEVTVRVSSSEPDTDLFLALVRPDDAQAWLDGAAVRTVTGVGGTLDEPRAQVSDAGSGPAADPRQADVWITTEEGAGSAGLRWPTTGQAVQDAAGAAAGTAALLVTADGTTPLEGTVDLQWSLADEDLRHPAAVPLLLVGAVLLVLAALLLLLGRRRGGGRRAGRTSVARAAEQEGNR